MPLKSRFVGLIALGALLFAACGEDSSPSAPSSMAGSASSPEALAARAEPASLQSSTSVGEILADPGGFVGRQVDLVGRLVQQLSAASFLFTDGTGALPLDFDPAGPAPSLNELIEVTGTVVPGAGDFAARIQVSSWDAQPPFSCDDVEDVRARFSDPGFVAGDVVGLYLAYRGLPPGEKTLEVDWGDGRVDTADVGEGRPGEDGRFALEGVVGHEYVDLKGSEEKSVRANLYVEGRDGSCSRVRSVTVAPGSGPGFAAGGNLRLRFNDPVTSGGFFSVTATVRNPTGRKIDANLVFTTPDRSSIRTLGAECQKISDEVVECRIEGIEGNGSGDTFVQYDVPVVVTPLSIRGSVTLITRDFSPVANYSTMVVP
jgi:hypothetical protein